MWIFILLSLVLLSLVACSGLNHDPNLISNAILAITGVIVAWYAYITSEMKNEMVKQRRLSASPILLIEGKGKTFFLTNYGTPATNIEISDVNVGKYETFQYPKILFLGHNDSQEIIGKTKSGSSFIDQNLHVYWNGLHGAEFEIQVSITYNDLTSRRYETLMKVGSGDHKIIHVKEQ